MFYSELGAFLNWHRYRNFSFIWEKKTYIWNVTIIVWTNLHFFLTNNLNNIIDLLFIFYDMSPWYLLQFNVMTPWLPFHNRLMKLFYFWNITTKTIFILVILASFYFVNHKWAQSHYILNITRIIPIPSD